MTIKIAVAYHKEAPRLESDIYMPIQVGSAMHPETDLGMQRDSDADNISDQNYTYCELTATYWLWKNVEADAKGIVHYRRAFGLHFGPGQWLRRAFHRLMGHNYISRIKCSYPTLGREAMLFAERLPELMERYDIIAPMPSVYKYTVEEAFSLIGHEYIDLMRTSVERLFPNYAPTLAAALKDNRLNYANMTVMRNDVFDSYCRMVFTVLEDVSRRLVDEHYLTDPTTERMFARKLGYLAELLTNMFIRHARKEGKRIKEMPVYFAG